MRYELSDYEWTAIKPIWFLSPVHFTGPKLKSSTDKGEDDYAPIIQ